MTCCVIVAATMDRNGVGEKPMSYTRRIVCVDMNAFFASIAQQRYKHLRGLPIAVTNGKHGGCVITSSYEARAYGVKTGMRFSEAKALCPMLLQHASEPEVYVRVSKKLMVLLERLVSPDIEVFSVDEAFLDVTYVQGLPACDRMLGQCIQAMIKKHLGLPASVGVSMNKTLAKYAAKLKKPQGVTVIAKKDAQGVLQHLPVQALCGIGPHITRHLARYGVHTCGQVAAMPASILSKRWGCAGQRMWLMCRGEDPDTVKTHEKLAQSMGHGKRLPPGCMAMEMLRFFLLHMAFKLSMRLKKHGMYAKRYWIGALHSRLGWLGEEIVLQTPCHDYHSLVPCVHRMMRHLASGVYVQVQITAKSLTQTVVHDLLASADSVRMWHRKKMLQAAIATIHQRFGDQSIRPAYIVKSLRTPDVIAPCWQPTGARQTVSSGGVL